ncbi:hypothetical protein AA12717_3888 [Gluconacetobacter sacchari DSM 12717]|uniref:Uncharacterized protein n=1 Tax=Gluconacetobacter sacchari DSM 12717 TaxID=1307940 RepID=A0ABQ0PCM8_9PROT|nr:hypothetical protein AA12717_3888 [Gluconacetobacter sacchari DSM 12717]
MARRWAIILCDNSCAIRNARTRLPQNIFRPLVSVTFTPFAKYVWFVSDPTPLSAFEDASSRGKKAGNITDLPSDSADTVECRLMERPAFPIREHGKLSEHHQTGAPKGRILIPFRRRGA